MIACIGCKTNLDRYDQSAQLWIGRADRWQTTVIQQWNETHPLPTPEEAGLPTAPGKTPEPPQKTKKHKTWWQ